VAALLAGDIDGMPRFGALTALKQFQGDKRFTVEVGSTAGKGVLSINNRKAPLAKCNLFPGKQVKNLGWCKVWVKAPGT
jgi:hypothetical protein